MVRIRIPKEHWGRVWRALVAVGPVSRMSEEPEYVVNQQQLALLRSKKLPFEIILKGNTHARENGHA